MAVCIHKSFISILIILLTSSLLDYGFAIDCFKCAVTPEKYGFRNRTYAVPMCSKFAETDEYITTCPYSTMCTKTISRFYLQNGHVTETITRGCAQQKETTQVFRNRQWQQEHSVQEVYEEGCVDFKANNLAVSTNTHCYCRGDLCNLSNTLALDITLFLIVLPVGKLILNYICF